jgi:hypothetical protein
MSTLTKYFPLIITLAGTLGAAIFTPDFIAHHAAAFAAVNALAQVLHAALPSVFGAPKN